MAEPTLQKLDGRLPRRDGSQTTLWLDDRVDTLYLSVRHAHNVGEQEPAPSWYLLAGV